MQLNPQQLAAVHYSHGPLLVLAGAGSGKTRVISEKIAYLIQQKHLLPEKIAALTFTNKAAREMRKRVGKMLGKEIAKAVIICTFHSLGLKIIRYHCDTLGLRNGFSIFDPQDCSAILRDLLPKGTKPEQVDAVRWQISNWKNAGNLPEHLEIDSDEEFQQHYFETYQKYQQQLINYNGVDFDDLILLPLQLLRTDPNAQIQWQERIRYLMVDEYQDTNGSQYDLVKLIVGERAAFTVVGDDDQSIYGWRGAQAENLGLLKQDFKQLELIKLEQNYRSTPTILNAANHLIANNPHEFTKKLWSNAATGNNIRILKCTDAEHEAQKVAGEILHGVFTGQQKHGDFAILYRSNFQSRAFEKALRQHRIPYLLSGGLGFFERSEIKDIMSYLRLLSNLDDDHAFLRVINTPRREIGASSVAKLAKLATERNISLFQACSGMAIENVLGLRKAKKFKDFSHWLNELTQLSEENPLLAINKLIEDIDYQSWIKEQSKDAALALRRMENISDLVEWMSQLYQQNERSQSLAELISELCLMTDHDKDPDETSDCVRLMTLHASKGLEFPHVFLVAVEEGILPHANSIEQGTLDEERRLAYVGITRAEKNLIISYATKRSRFGEINLCKPSRFLSEIPSDLVDWEGRDGIKDKAAAKTRARAHIASLKGMFDD